jgi:hypothetical protein
VAKVAVGQWSQIDTVFFAFCDNIRAGISAYFGIPERWLNLTFGDKSIASIISGKLWLDPEVSFRRFTTSVEPLPANYSRE